MASNAVNRVRTAVIEPLVRLAPVAFLAFICASAPGETIQPPRSPDGSVKISLFASEPDLVTPIGATIDSHGRLLVIESNTHFPPKNYKGHKTDRIVLLQETTGSGKADRISTFFEGEHGLMNLVADRDGSIVVSSRNEIFRLTVKEGADTSDARISLAKLQTVGDYPHNGLHGLAIDAAGTIYFAIGENKGLPWKLVGTDGKTISNDTGCGMIFSIDPQGHGLNLVARGLWNTFGLGFDPAGNFWAVDNDPDGRPPCRLIDVVPGGDYGFIYRYGRTGMHPLQAWDGELPGTLKMVGGVGEAPCAVQWQRGGLLVSSWRDHQVEAYTLTPHGATYAAAMHPLLTGGESFRPVGIAVDSDRVVYITDWGSSSYSVNGLGRVWKVEFPGRKASEESAPPVGEAMRRAAGLRRSVNSAELVEALDDEDAAIAQAAQFGISHLTDAEKIKIESLRTPRQRIGLLAALLWRGTPMGPYVALALNDPDDRVRQMAVRAIADQQIVDAKEGLNKLLDSQLLSPRLLGMTLATINQLNGDRTARIDSGKINGVLLARISSPQATDQSKAVSLRMLQASHPKIPMAQMQQWVQSASQPLQLETIRFLADDSDPNRFSLLAEIAGDEKSDPVSRAEAIDGLSDDATAQIDFLLKRADDPLEIIRQESLRSLRSAAPAFSAPERAQLTAIAEHHPSDAELVNRLLGQHPTTRPAATETAAWQAILDRAPGDPDAGRRIFFHHSGAGCYRCHMIEGRGRSIGPDLTMIGHSQTREHILESILQPSLEIAPLYTLWTITTRNGQRIDGMLLRRDTQAVEVYADASGQETRVAESSVADRKMQKESLMPSGLEGALTDQEFRDMVAFLMQKR